jgi:general secretion pathway protein M
LAVIVLAYHLLWQPLVSAKASYQQQNQRAEQQLVAVRELATQYRQLQNSGAKATVSAAGLPQLINSTVLSHQLAVQRLQPSASGDVQVRFENVSFNALLAWLNDIELGHGVIVKDMAVNRAEASGQVNVTLRVQAG